MRLTKPYPFRDYISWLTEQDLAKAESFWRETLEGFSGPTPLGIDVPVKDSTDQREGHYESEELTVLSETTSSALSSIGQEHEITLNTLVQGAWAMLLRHYSGESDIVFGTTVAGRPAELRGVEKMVGLFINTLPVRASISQSDRVIPWMKDLQRQLVEIPQYEYAPLSKVQSWSEVPRGVSLFHSIVAFENYPVDKSVRSNSGNLGISDLRSLERNNYPLALVVVPGDQLFIYLRYDNRRFESRSIGNMGEHLKALLEGVAEDPERRVVELSGMRETEERSYNIEFNETEEYFPRTASIHELIEEQVRKRPLEVALWKGEEKLSYEELNGRANRLGRELASKGIGEGSRVGILQGHGFGMVESILGVLKTGACYVPFEPSQPVEKLRRISEDARLAMVITDREYKEKAVQISEVEKLVIDEERAEIEGEELGEVSSEANAYVIYTSGSTGEAKGVEVSHRSLVNYIYWAARKYVGEEREDGRCIPR